MPHWKILHNPKCSKSREALQFLRERGVEPEIVEYLKTPLTVDELNEVMAKLDSEPASMVRTKDVLYKDLSFSLNSKEEIVHSIAKHPALLQRPIIINNDRAVIGRPTENISRLL